MKIKRQLSALFLGAALVCGPALGWSQPASLSQDSGAKRDMKDAGHETKDAAKDTGRGVKQGTRKTCHKTKHATRKAWRKTSDTTKGAVDGGKEGARRPE
jgi:Ni/Co efflux regulator RcnB